MIFVVHAANRGHFAADIQAMHCHRNVAFVIRAGDDTVYLPAKDDPFGPVLASARLLKTTGPHLMRDLYSASDRLALPSGPLIWEISRYCTAPGLASRNLRLSLMRQIICGSMETAINHGIKHLIFAANRALLPHALRCGWDPKTMGLAHTNDGPQ